MTADETRQYRDLWLKAVARCAELGFRVFRLTRENERLALQVRCLETLVSCRQLRCDFSQDAAAVDEGMGG